MTTETDQVEVNETATETVETHEEVREKSFSQEQLDKIVEDRLLKQRRQFERKYSGVDLDYSLEVSEWRSLNYVRAVLEPLKEATKE